ncbi:hypothetical protein L53_02500 [Hyphomonas sp. L-53-1-40]|nr:hypothetical protein L53_02500 [Hyphomonas sp. L-53-1-40]
MKIAKKLREWMDWLRILLGLLLLSLELMQKLP